MVAEVAGKLTRDEDKKDEEDSAAPAWGSIKTKGERNDISDKKYPTLKSAMEKVGGSTNINLDDGSDAKINIATSKNAFSALEGAHDSDEDGPKRTKEIKPAMVTKKKGEFEKDALKREVDKYTEPKGKKDSKKKKGDEDDEDDEDEDEEEDAEEEAVAVQEVKKAKKKGGEKKEEKKEQQEEDEEKAEDLIIKPDLHAAKEKYKNRRKLPTVDL